MRKTKNIPIQQSVRQGCVLSPLLFKIYSVHIFDRTFQDTTYGIKMNGNPINNLRFADDTPCITDNPEELRMLDSNLTRKHTKI